MADTDPFAVDWYQLQDNYAIVASGVLWTLDYLDTLPMEIALLWKRKTGISLAAILYFVGRYSLLFYAYMRISYLARGTVTNKFCADTSYPTAVALELADLCTNSLLLLRAYAICHKSRVILALGSGMILARCGHGSYINFTLEVPIAGQGRPFDPRCTWIRMNDSHDTLFQRSQFVTPALALALDTLVFVAIITPTFGLVLEMRRLRRTGFIERVVRDGALYYIVVLGLAVCIAAATFSVTTGKGTSALNSLGQIIAPFFNLVPNILASRIFLNTHFYADSDGSAPTLLGNRQEASRDIKFATRVMGSLGEPLQSDLYGDSVRSEPTVHADLESQLEGDGEFAEDKDVTEVEMSVLKVGGKTRVVRDGVSGEVESSPTESDHEE